MENHWGHDDEQLGPGPSLRPDGSCPSVTRLLGLVDSFNGLRVFVVGDLILDHYLVGSTQRVSREYPVIVLVHEGDEYRLGGAANTAANLASLGAEVIPVGYLGQDPHGDIMLDLLERIGCSTEFVVREATYNTVTKTRVSSRGPGGTPSHQMLRIDRLNAHRRNDRMAEQLTANVVALADDAHGMLVSDYGHGTVAPDISRACIREMGERYVGLDSRHALLMHRGVTVATPNIEEASEAVGFELCDKRSIVIAGQELTRHLNAEAVLITKGSDGMSLFEKDCKPTHLGPAVVNQVLDVTGAGDAVAATVLLARLAGGSYLEAAHLANFAGGLSTRRAGASPVPLDDLLRMLERLDTGPGTDAPQVRNRRGNGIS